ncbi:hypothetical protein BHM03_00045697 [Ensete ventricosum]|nr:hypothetical protein BHM03_00045697 [Ensete ventricosum]
MPGVRVVRRALAGGERPTLPSPGRLYDSWRSSYNRSISHVELATSVAQVSEGDDDLAARSASVISNLFLQVVFDIIRPQDSVLIDKYLRLVPRCNMGRMSLPRHNQLRGESFDLRLHSLRSETRTYISTPRGDIGTYSTILD